MEIIDKVKTNLKKIINNIHEYQTFNKIKNNIIINKNELIVQNIDTSKLINKYKLNQYLNSLIEKYPSNEILFNNCVIDDLNVILTKSATFKDCTIERLYLKQNNICSTKFENCIFNFDKANQKVVISVSSTNINKCITKINNNKNCSFMIGKDINSTVKIKDFQFINKNDKSFQMHINTNNLTLINYLSPECASIILNENNNKRIDYMHLLNSETVFSKNHPIIANVILIENSNIKRMITECESVEISGKCMFNDVGVLSCEEFFAEHESVLDVKNTNISTKLLECSSNCEINDITNKFKWLNGIGRINVEKGFKLKFNGKTIYEKISQNYSNSDSEDIINIVKRERRTR